MLLLVRPCAKEAPSRFDQAQQEAANSGQAVAKEHKVVTSTNSFRQPVMALSESIPKRKKALQAKLKKG